MPSDARESNELLSDQRAVSRFGCAHTPQVPDHIQVRNANHLPLIRVKPWLKAAFGSADHRAGQGKRLQLQQLPELLLCDTGLADESPECALGQFTMVGHRQAPARRVTEDDMTAGLVVYLVAHTAKGPDRTGA